MIKIGMGWQISDMKDYVGGIRKGLEYYEKKFGRHPDVVEYSMKVDPKDLPSIDTVRFHKISVPKNILIIGVS